MNTADLSDTIIPKSDQLNADDLLAGPLTVTIKNVTRGSHDQPISIEIPPHQPYKPCKSMRRVLIMAWGKNGKEWIGKSMTLYCDPSVRFGGVAVGGIRISHMSGLSEPTSMLLTTTRSKRKPFTVEPLLDAPKQQDAPTQPPPDLETDACDAANSGTAAFKEWWKSMDGASRATLKADMDTFKAMAEKADKSGGENGAA